MSNLLPRDQYLDPLDRILTDPEVDRILDKAKLYEKIVNEAGNSTAQDRLAFVAELDSMWESLGYMGTEVETTGWLIFPKLVDPESPPETEHDLLFRPAGGNDTYVLEQSYCDAQPVRSNGFCFISDHLTLGSSVIEQWRIAYAVVVQSTEKPGTQIEGAGRIDKVFFNFSHSSNEHTRNRLGYFHPEIIEEIDSLVLNQENEEEAVLALGGMVVGATDDDPDDRQMLADIGNYLTEIIPFDKTVPYQMSCMGLIVQPRADGSFEPHAVEISGSLVTPHFVRLVSFGERDKITGEKLYVPCLKLDFHLDDSDLPPHQLFVPTRTLKKFFSIHRAVYQGS